MGVVSNNWLERVYNIHTCVYVYIYIYIWLYSLYRGVEDNLQLGRESGIRARIAEVPKPGSPAT